MKKYKNGGIVPNSAILPIVSHERCWWKCKKCGGVYESWTIPPHTHCSTQTHYNTRK